MNMKHFTVIELNSDAISPMIGTICNVRSGLNDADRFSLKERLVTACEEHFDAEVHLELPDVDNEELVHDVDIKVYTNDDGWPYHGKIRLLVTWLY